MIKADDALKFDATKLTRAQEFLIYRPESIQMQFIPVGKNVEHCLSLFQGVVEEPDP